MGTVLKHCWKEFKDNIRSILMRRMKREKNCCAVEQQIITTD